MTIRSLHRVVGLVMVLPFLGWAVTGAIFFLKPGYGSAYDALAVRTYPFDAAVTIPSNPAWLEARYVRTTLGEHLLVRSSAGWQHLDARTLAERPLPGEPDLRRLLEDAFAANPVRYGHVSRLDGRAATTDTGVRVSIDWNRLAFSQRGPDTDRIDGIYKIHYLQWTGIVAIDRVLGALGLGLIVLLAVLGVRLWLR